MTGDRAAVADLLTVTLARTVVPGDFVGVGLGTPLALVAALVARRLTDGVHLLAGGALDVAGDVDVWLGGPDATRGLAAGYVPHLDSMDMAERQTMTLQFLRPAQVDGYGNVNTSRIGPRKHPSIRFPGGLATADVPGLLPRVVAYLTHHSPRNLPERVSFVTGSGAAGSDPQHPTAGVVTLVTDLAVIDLSAGEARTVSIHPWATASEVAGSTGFQVVVDEHVVHTPVPSGDEQAALAAVDPLRRRDLEIKGSVKQEGSEVTA